MAGGQKGLSFVGEPMVFASAATFAVTVLLQLQLGCLSTGDTSAMDEANEECEVAWVAANDNDPESVPAGVVEEPWCVEHNQAMRVEQKQDDMETIGVEAAP
jgi:hypothetical protein